jgi:hypothetical protein
MKRKWIIIHMNMNDWLIKHSFFLRERERYWRTRSLIQDLRGPPAIHLHFHFSSITNELRFLNNIRVLHIYCSFCIHIQADLICNFETECLHAICHAFLPSLHCLNTCVVGEMSTVFNSETIGLVTVKFGSRDSLMSVHVSAKWTL